MQFLEKRHGYFERKMVIWQTLVQVCRRWQSVVFGSPRRLGLQLVCTTKTSTGTLDVWPALPLVIEDEYCQKEGLIALLERSDLVRRITQIYLHNVHLEDISEAMEVPFPELTDLTLSRSNDETEPLIPLSDSFLGGSAPQLQFFILDRIPFPGLPKILSSATHLTDLRLIRIPHSGYISPEALAACLSMLTSLGYLFLQFQSPQYRLDRESRRPPPSTRTVLPALTRFLFKGVSEYLEDLVACVDIPQLNHLDITFFNDIVFDTSQLSRLIHDIPTFKAFDKATVSLWYAIASVRLSSKASGGGELNVEIQVLCRELDWQVSFLEQVCTSSFSLLSTLEDLYVNDCPYSWPVRENNNVLWLELLHPFTTVKNIFLSEGIAPHVVPALQELVGGRTAEVLPTLQNVFIERLQPSGPVQEGVEKFIAARQLTSHPIAVSRWDKYPSLPQAPHNLDLSPDALRINPEEPAQAEYLPGSPSPVALVPESGHLTVGSESPPDFMAASAASTRPSNIDLFL